MAEKRELTVFEAASIVAGYGIGAGIMAIPALVARSGIWTALIVIAVAYGVSVILHLIIAQLALGASRTQGGGVQIVAIFRAYLFRGRLREPLSWVFFVLMVLVLTLNLAAYVAGTGDILAGLTGFLGFVRLAGGAIALLVALLVVPAYLVYRHGEKRGALEIMSGPLSAGAWPWIAMASNLLMAVGSFI